jgi:predicted glycoside hydrolase/deacetylase ChbG (UPF0249 family)
VIVTADDVGLSPGVTRGAIEAARRGVVRSASLIVNMPESDAAAEETRTVAGLELGLHLNIVAGEPVSDPSEVPSLLDRDGRFLALAALARRLARGGVRATEVAREVRAQVIRARRLGIPALAWDSHRHTHLLPPLARVVGAVAREFGVRYVRRAGMPPSWAGQSVAKRRLLALLSRASAPFYRGVRGNDWYVDLSAWTPRPEAADLGSLASLGGVGEVGAHPGYADELLAARDTLVSGREREVRLLCDPTLRLALGDDLVRHRVTW